MGGTEGSRGYLYQGIVSIIEAFTIPGWNKIYVEYPSDNDKIDIALEKDGTLIKSIQVKSTINSFSTPEMVRWIKDIVSDKRAEQYQLILVGNCDNNAQKLKKSIDKYYCNNVDKEAEKMIMKIGLSFLAANSISISVLPYEINYLMDISVASLHQMLSNRHLILSHDVLSFIVSALIGDQMILSTMGEGCLKEDFDNNLDARIRLIIKNYSPKRISLGIRSFSRGAESMEGDTEKMICLLDSFSGRYIKKEYDWNQDVLKSISKFLLEETSKDKAYQIYLDTHSCIAFAAGRLFDTKSGINISPIQKSPTPIIWERDPLDATEYSSWAVQDERLSYDVFDTALIISITRDIYDDVVEYIKEESLPISRIISCFLDKTQANKYSIANGTHCAQLSSSIDIGLRRRSSSERRATLHIFSSAPNAFMFHLGQNSRSFGKSIILYEYDFEQAESCSYFPTIQI